MNTSEGLKEIPSAVFDEKYSGGKVDFGCVKFSANVSVDATPTSAKRNETNFYIYWGNQNAAAPFYKPDPYLTAVSESFNVDGFYTNNSLISVGIDRNERSGSKSERIIEFRSRVTRSGRKHSSVGNRVCGCDFCKAI